MHNRTWPNSRVWVLQFIGPLWLSNLSSRSATVFRGQSNSRLYHILAPQSLWAGSHLPYWDFSLSLDPGDRIHKVDRKCKVSRRLWLRASCGASSQQGGKCSLPWGLCDRQFYVSLIEAKVIWDEGTMVKKMSPYRSGYRQLYKAFS